MERPYEQGEEWRPVVGYEGQYEISNLGRVWSVPRDVDRSGHGIKREGGKLRALVPSGIYGYLYIWLPGGKQWAVHRLVAEAFLGPRPPKAETRHLDGDRLNNRVGNLAYGTSTENKQDQRRHGTNYHSNRTHCPQGHPYDELNTKYRRTGGRDCRACDRERQQRRRATQRLLASS